MDDNFFQNSEAFSVPPLIVPKPMRVPEAPDMSYTFEPYWEYMAFMNFMQNFPVSSQPEPNINFEKIPSIKESKLEEPMKDLADSNICTECNQSFLSFKGMKQHFGKVHLKSSKTTACNVCSKLFKNKYALHFHVKQVHEQRTRVFCTVCDKQLYNKYILKKHMRDQHPSYQ